MNVRETYDGSNGEATKDLYARLEKLGPAGYIAANLLRAQKCSNRAKAYRGHGYKAEAYGRKNWSINNLCDMLIDLGHGGVAAWRWGWKEDAKAEYHKWVLYVEIPTGQVSFHAASRGTLGPDYPGEWDGSRLSAERIINWCEDLLGEPRTKSIKTTAGHSLQKVIIEEWEKIEQPKLI